MRLARLHGRFARVFNQRCFYLFVSLLALIIAVPFALESQQGRLAISLVQVFVLISAVAAVGRTVMPFVIALLLAIPAFGFQVVAMIGEVDPSRASVIANAAYIAFYVTAIVYLLGYVFNPEVMTGDKLFGAAAGYLMLGLVWAYAYALAQRLEPGAFGVAPGGVPKTFHDLLFMSFGALTSNGPGDIALVGARVRTLVLLEQISGTLFVAILIARLASGYLPKEKDGADPT
jgi:hypothetical protein